MAHSSTARQQLPSAQSPRYSTQAFDAGYSLSSYNNYSAGVSEYDYDSSNLAPKKNRNQSQLEVFGSRVLDAFSDTKGPLHTRAKSLADAAGPMLARTTSIRLGGLLNRTPTQKQTKPVPEEEDGRDYEEPDDLPEYKPTLTSTPERSGRSTPRTQTPSKQRPTTRAGRFSWFAGREQTSADTPTHRTSTSASASAALELEDPLLTLNINANLFPTGNTDPLNPDSFNDLLINACALIDRLQAGYREKTQLLRQANAERDAAVEEKDEAGTRAAHLRAQMGTLAARATEQEGAIRDLGAQLTAERQRRREREEQDRAADDEGRQDSMVARRMGEDEDGTPRRAGDDDDDHHSHNNHRAFRRGTRRSDGTVRSTSDSGFESDAESACFSLDTASTLPSGAVNPALFDGGSVLSPKHHPSSGVATDYGWTVAAADAAPLSPLGRRGAVRGGAGAWSVVGDLQRENHRLKGRVRELEGAVEGCLSLVAM